jgi:hypothetical protein
MQNGRQFGPALTDSSTGSTWAITTGTLPDGNYTAVASQQDSAVNFGYSNIVSFTVDTVPPSPQLDQPPAFISDRVGVTISGSSPPAANGGDDLFVTAAITKLESGVTTSHFAVVDQATGAFSIILPLRGDGHYTATVYQSDVAHPFTPDTPPSDTVSFIVDSTPPTVTCDTPAPSFSVGGTGVVTATVTDALSGPAASTVSAPADLSTLGTRTVTVTGSDRAGNMTSVACPYTVGARITILSPQPGTAIGSGGIVPVSFALTDGSGSRLTRAQAQALANSCAVRVWLDSRTPVCATYDASTRTFRATLYIPKQATQGTHTVTVGVYSGSTLVSSRSVDITYGAATKPR